MCIQICNYSNHIDVIINNAGVTFGYSRNAKLSNTGISLNKFNAFGNIETDKWLPIFKANCIAPLLLAQLLYKLTIIHI